MVAYCGLIITKIHYNLQLIRLQNKAKIIRIIIIINDVPLQDHITPHYVNLGLLKF